MNLFKSLLKKFLIFTVLTTLISLWFVGYSYKKYKEILVDNPTLQEIKVRIDNGEEVVIPARTSKIMKITAWNHKVFLNWKEVWDFERKKFFFHPLSYLEHKNDILNPTKSTYFFETNYFWEAPKDLPEDREKSDLYMREIYNFGIWEKVPKEVKLSKGKKYTTKVKIYRDYEYKYLFTEIDNSFDKDVKVKIDDWEEITFKAGDVWHYKISEWEHTVLVDGKEIWKFTKKMPENYDAKMWYSVLNLAKVRYVNAFVYYFSPEFDEKLNDEKILEKFNKEVVPKYSDTFVSDFFIEPKYNFNLVTAYIENTEDLPEELALPEGQDYVFYYHLMVEDYFAENFPESYEELLKKSDKK